MRPRPGRLDRLPPQYFAALLGRVAEAAARDGEPVVDLGRGNPETGPPPHVVEALVRAADRPDVHGYAPFRGLPKLREAIAARYRNVYGVELDPEREVAVVPGTKTAIVELALAVAERGEVLGREPIEPAWTRAHAAMLFGPAAGPKIHPSANVLGSRPALASRACRHYGMHRRSPTVNVR